MPLKKITGDKAATAAFMIGFIALWDQAVITRRLMAAFAGNELTIAMCLSAWMTWTGAGAAATSAWAGRLKKPENFLALAFASLAALTPAALLSTALIKEWLGSPLGETAGPGVMMLACFLVTLPLGFPLGLAFNLAARMQVDREAPAGRTYGLEALGAFAAGIILALWFRDKSSPASPAWAASILLITMAAFVPDRPRAGRWSFALVLELTALAAFALAGGPARQGSLDVYYNGLFWRGLPVKEAFDSRYSYLAAGGDGHETTIYVDGSPAATFPDERHDQILAHLPLALAPSPKRVLVVGGGFSGLAGEILLHPVERLDYIVLDPGFLELEREYAPDFGRLSRDPRANVAAFDARPFLKSSERQYDVIIINLPDPHGASLGRYYTREFLELAASRLSEAGVLAFTAGSTPPNLSYDAGQLAATATAYKTAGEVFDRVAIVPLGENLFLAGGKGSRVAADFSAIQKTMDERGVVSFYVNEKVLSAEVQESMIREVADRLEAADAKTDRDLNPRAYASALLTWAEKTSPRAAGAAAFLARAPAWMMLVFPVLALAAGRALARPGKAAAFSALAAGVTGYASMTASFGLMLAFQSLVGSIYHMLAFFSACFMAGLGVGSLLWIKGGGGWRPALAVSASSASAAALAVYLASSLGMDGPWSAGTLFALALFFQGVGGGAVFTQATMGLPREKENGALGSGLIYGADLAGGAAGGALAGVALTPLFGITGTLVSGAAMTVAVYLAIAGKKEEIFD